MEQTPIKKGYLFRPQKGIGLKKCWTKRWALLYPGSEVQPPHLETFDSKVAASKEGSKSSSQPLYGSFLAVPTTKPHRSRDHVFEINIEDKVIAYAVDSKEELEGWLEVFRDIVEGRAGNRTAIVPDLPSVNAESPQAEEGLLENTLYDSYETMTFKVAVKPSAFSESLNLQGSYYLQIDSVKLSLIEEDTNNLLFAWPYRYLRRYGRDKTSFSMEAGRKCESGPGMIIFLTKDGNDIFHNIQNFVNNISGRHGIPAGQGHSGIDGHHPQPGWKGASPGKAVVKPLTVSPRSNVTDPIVAITESSVFRQKLAERKDAVESSEDSSPLERRRPRPFQAKAKKETNPQLPVRQSELDPVYSVVNEDTGKAASDPAQVIPEGEYSLPDVDDRLFPRSSKPADLPESSEYDVLDTNRVMYNTPDDDSQGERWREHGRTEDNIHTENYFSDAAKILQDGGEASDPEPAKLTPSKIKHSLKPLPLPKARHTTRSKITKAPEAKRDPAESDVDSQTYDTVITLPSASSTPPVANGKDMYDHFVRPSIAHPVPAPRKNNPGPTLQVDDESELYDHLQRESSSGAPRMPKSYLPSQRSFDQDDTYNTLVHEPKTGGSSPGAGINSLPDESQYSEAVLAPEPSVAGADDTGLDENPYDLVAYQ